MNERTSDNGDIGDCGDISHQRSVLYPNNSVELDGSVDNGRISFGRPPLWVRRLRDENPTWARALQVRPVIVLLSFSVETSGNVECIFDFVGRNVDGSTTPRRFRFFRTDPGQPVSDVFVQDLWVPVDNVRGHPFDMRITTTNKTGSIMLSLDYQWAPWSKRDEVVRSTR